MKRIFYFAPDNIMKRDSGNKTRMIDFLKYFQNRGFEVDFFSDRIWEHWSENDVTMLEKTGLVSNVNLLDRKPSKSFFLKYLYVKAKQAIINRRNGIDTRTMPNYATEFLCQMVYKLIEGKKYDFVILNYVAWAQMIDKREYFPGAKFIVDTHDLMTSQYQSRRKGKYLGDLFQAEIDGLNKFDQIWAISTDEHYIFSQFCSKEVLLVSGMLEDNTEIQDREYKYDVIYVASDNSNNKLSAKWFMDEVYPLLPKDIKICIVGKITKQIEDKENIEKILFAPSLTDYYKHSKIAICPMLKGTGIKIKVTEALSFGLPIVCNQRGADGLPNKMNNGCMVTDDPQTFANNISLLLNNKEIYNKYSEQSKEMFLTCFDINMYYKKLDNIFNIK